MSSRTQERRQRGFRHAGVWRGASTRSAAAGDRPAVQHHEQRNRPVSWRLFSAAIVICLSIILGIFFTADAFFVRSVSVSGLRYLTREEVFAFADIANMHIFWVSPSAVRGNILRSNSIADARVTLGWPPNMINIFVEEREPALVWEQSGTAIWVDIQGRVMAQREDRPELIRISADLMVADGPLGETGRVTVDVVYGALQLQELLPGTPLLRYDGTKGLGIRDENGWDVWFGTGQDMPNKILIYETLKAELLARGAAPGEINIVNARAPFYTQMWGR